MWSAPSLQLASRPRAGGEAGARRARKELSWRPMYQRPTPDGRSRRAALRALQIQACEHVDHGRSRCSFQRTIAACRWNPMRGRDELAGLEVLASRVDLGAALDLHVDGAVPLR